MAKDRKTCCFVVHVVPGNGAKSDWIAVQLARDLRKIGYFGRVVLRSDSRKRQQKIRRFIIISCIIVNITGVS